MITNGKFRQVMPISEFHAGMKLNHLTLLEKLPKGKYEHQNGIFLCDCGTKKIIKIKFVLRNTTVSCGCFIAEIARARFITHGKSHLPEHSVWKGLIKRCHGQSPEEHYGERGITVCNRWRNSFEDFYADMGSRPSDKHSIERMDVNGNYEPNNCKWATPKEQSRNKVKTIFYEYKGEVLPAIEWSEKFSIKYTTLKRRIENGWSVEKALETPVRSSSGTKEKPRKDQSHAQ